VSVICGRKAKSVNISAFDGKDGVVCHTSFKESCPPGIATKPRPGDQLCHNCMYGITTASQRLEETWCLTSRYSAQMQTFADSAIPACSEPPLFNGIFSHAPNAIVCKTNAKVGCPLGILSYKDESTETLLCHNCEQEINGRNGEITCSRTKLRSKSFNVFATAALRDCGSEDLFGNIFRHAQIATICRTTKEFGCPFGILSKSAMSMLLCHNCVDGIQISASGLGSEETWCSTSGGSLFTFANDALPQCTGGKVVSQSSRIFRQQTGVVCKTTQAFGCPYGVLSKSSDSFIFCHNCGYALQIGRHGSSDHVWCSTSQDALRIQTFADDALPTCQNAPSFNGLFTNASSATVCKTTRKIGCPMGVLSKSVGKMLLCHNCDIALTVTDLHGSSETQCSMSKGSFQTFVTDELQTCILSAFDSISLNENNANAASNLVASIMGLGLGAALLLIAIIFCMLRRRCKKRHYARVSSSPMAVADSDYSQGAALDELERVPDGGEDCDGLMVDKSSRLAEYKSST